MAHVFIRLDLTAGLTPLLNQMFNPDREISDSLACGMVDGACNRRRGADISEFAVLPSGETILPCLSSRAEPSAPLSGPSSATTA